MCVSQWVIISFFYHHALLTWKSLYKYKLLWGGREGRGLSLYNEVSHTYMLNDDDVVLPKWMRFSSRLSCWLLWMGYLTLIKKKKKLDTWSNGQQLTTNFRFNFGLWLWFSFVGNCIKVVTNTICNTLGLQA